MTDARDETDAEARIAALEAELARTVERLRETDHRIKNDLQLIASVFVLQTRRLPDGEGRDMIRGALERVNAVAAVHRRLDVGGDPKHFEVSALVRELAEEAAAGRGEGVDLAIEVAPVTIPARQAAPLALIVGELVRNAVGHGFPGRSGLVDVRLGAADGTVQFSVRDDGVGLAADAAKGFGTTLVALLAQQLRGKFEIGPAQSGVRAVVRFPESA